MDKRVRGSRDVARLIGLHDDDGSFDREFWSRVPAAERMQMAWGMALESLQWRGDRARQPRLQRSVCRIQRGRG